jgi:hypothetical protein
LMLILVNCFWILAFFWQMLSFWCLSLPIIFSFVLFSFFDQCFRCDARLFQSFLICFLFLFLMDIVVVMIIFFNRFWLYLICSFFWWMLSLLMLVFVKCFWLPSFFFFWWILSFWCLSLSTVLSFLRFSF